MRVAGRKWKDEVLTIAAERFNSRVGQEIGALRLDMAKEFGAVRGEMAAMDAGLRAEMAETRFSMLKWAFVFWIGQLAAMTGIMALLLRTIVPR
jgi:hypothetical protein